MKKICKENLAIKPFILPRDEAVMLMTERQEHYKQEHIISWLLNQCVSYIFYPCVPYERKEFDEAGNHYNCPIVTSYGENIKNNVSVPGLLDHALDGRGIRTDDGDEPSR